jgi:putative glutamine amidotransferase
MGKQNKQPVIGISMSLDEARFRKGIQYSVIRHEYGEQVRASGGQPIFLENTIDPEVAAGLCDGIIISGGEDIEPSFYGQEDMHTIIREPAMRTEWERKLIDACDKKGIHILGVCYGLQLLNIHYGGTLYQDMMIQKGDTLDHGSSAGSVMQRVTFADNFLSFEKGDSVETAHRHHQAIHDIAKGFKATAITEDGVVEAIAGHGHYGIQWHSESDGTAPNIYGSFIALCAGKSETDVALDPASETA